MKNALQDWTEYGYNEVGNLIWIEDANDHRTNYEYDGVGRRTATILPLEQRSDSVFDAVGNLKTYTDFNRNTTTYSYDPMNWMTSKQFQDGSKVTYAYTTVGLQDVIKFVDTSGQITATYDYDYDVQDRQIQRTDNIGGVIRSINYAYDVAGNRSSVTTASGTVNYTFDVRNRLDKVIENSVVTADYDYDAVSNLISTTFANGTQEIRQYDDLNRLKYLENHQGSTILSSYTYTLDKAGNRQKVVENTGRVVEYIYDDLYRLLSEKITDAVNGNRIYDYTFDKVGNRKTKSEIVNGTTTVTNYAYDANDRLLDETVNQLLVGHYTYDNNGNTLTKTENGITTEYDWDYENRLIAAIVKDANGAIQQAMQYRYNDNGIRVASTVNGVETQYLIDEVQPYAQVLEEYSPNGAVLVEYVYGNDLIAQEQGNSRTFYHVDGLGSTRVLTDEQGSVVSTYDYEAYGELIGSTGGVENKYLFAGEQFDEGLGDYYNRARYYDADTGRFTRRDDYEGRINEPLTLHKYIYTEDNPVNFTDPSGFFASLNEVSASQNISDTLERQRDNTNIQALKRFTVKDNEIFAMFGVTRRLIPHASMYAKGSGTRVFAPGQVKKFDVGANDGWDAIRHPFSEVNGGLQINVVYETELPKFALKQKFAQLDRFRYAMWEIAIRVIPSTESYTLVGNNCITWTLTASAFAKVLERSSGL